MKKTIISLGMLTLIGCSVAIIGKNYGGKSETLMQQSVVKNAPSSLIYANKYGNYLAGRTASISGDHQNAAQFLGHIANLEKQQAPKMLGALAIRHYLLSGEVEKAIKLLKFHVSEKNDGYDGLLQIVDSLKPSSLKSRSLKPSSLKQGDVKAANAALKNIKVNGFAGLFIPFVQSWVEFELTKKPVRITVADSLPHAQFRNLQHYHEALQLELSGEIAKAQAIYEKHIVELEKTPDAMIFAAMRFFVANGNPKQALELLEKIRNLRPRDAFWHMRNSEKMLDEIVKCDYFKVKNAVDGVAESLANIGYILANEGALEEGQILLQLAIYLRPDNDLYKLILAESLEEADNFSAAIKQYQQIKQPPFVADLVQISIARALYGSGHGLGETQQARELLQELAGKLPVKYNIAVMLGDLERAAGNDKAAIAHYDTALAAIGKPRNIDWPLLFRRGILHDAMGDWVAAQADFATALALSPDEPEVVNYLSYSWLLRGEKLEQAKQMLKSAVDAAPNNAHIIDSYGFALYKMGDYKEALQVLEQALEMIPSDPTVNDHYADALWRLGRKGEAEFHWKRALLFKPTEKGAKAAIKLKLKNGLADIENNSVTSEKVRVQQ